MEKKEVFGVEVEDYSTDIHEEDNVSSSIRRERIRELAKIIRYIRPIMCEMSHMNNNYVIGDFYIEQDSNKTTIGLNRLISITKAGSGKRRKKEERIISEKKDVIFTMEQYGVTNGYKDYWLNYLKESHIYLLKDFLLQAQEEMKRILEKKQYENDKERAKNEIIFEITKELE